MTVGERLKKARKNKGYSQEELAKLLNYKSRSSINKLENGRDIPRNIIVKLAKLLDVTPAYLIGWDEKENDTELSNQKNLILSPHEEKVITAYRSHPNMQDAVDKLLGIEQSEEKLYKIQIAARNGDNKEITVTDSELQSIISGEKPTDFD